MDMVIIKWNAGGGETRPMLQPQAQSYLGNLLQGTRLTNLSQALNQAFNGQGKACGALSYGGHPALHASAGVPGVSSVTLFYYLAGVTLYCFAMGEHRGAASYRICDFGPPDGAFQFNRTVQL